VKLRYKGAGRRPDEQMRISFDVAHHGPGADILRDFRPGELQDGRFTMDEVPATDVYVNLFDGGPRSTVEMSIGGRHAIAMTRVRRPDPTTLELFERYKATIKPWAKADPSSHLFVADLPDDLGPGTYTLSVRAVDEYGAVHHAHRVVEILGSSAAPSSPVRYPD